MCACMVYVTHTQMSRSTDPASGYSCCGGHGAVTIVCWRLERREDMNLKLGPQRRHCPYSFSVRITMKRVKDAILVCRSATRLLKITVKLYKAVQQAVAQHAV